MSRPRRETDEHDARGFRAGVVVCTGCELPSIFCDCPREEQAMTEPPAKISTPTAELHKPATPCAECATPLRSKQMLHFDVKAGLFWCDGRCKRRYLARKHLIERHGVPEHKARDVVAALARTKSRIEAFTVVHLGTGMAPDKVMGWLKARGYDEALS